MHLLWLQSVANPECNPPTQGEYERDSDESWDPHLSNVPETDGCLASEHICLLAVCVAVSCGWLHFVSVGRVEPQSAWVQAENLIKTEADQQVNEPGSLHAAIADAVPGTN